MGAGGTDDTVFTGYGHCSKGVQGSYSLLLVNFAEETTTVTLPTHGNRTEYVLTAGDDDGLLSKKTVLNGGGVLAASPDGKLPPGRSTGG